MSSSLLGILLFVGAVVVHRTMAKRAWDRLDEPTQRRIGEAQARSSGVRSLLIFLLLVLSYAGLKTRWPASPWPSLGFIAVLLVVFVGASVSQYRQLEAVQAPREYRQAIVLGKAILTAALLGLFGLVLVRGGL